MLADDDVQSVHKLNDAYRRLVAELGRVIVGQQQVIEELLIAMFARGHCLLVGVPGLAKTLLIRTLADTLSLKFSRIQFTPDLMPSDITGTEVIQEDKASGVRQFKFLAGPIFANVILADEINRTPPKTQAALLEAMQEHQVTVGGTQASACGAVLRAGHAKSRSSRKGPIPCPKRSSIASCSTRSSIIRTRMKSWKSCAARRPTRCRRSATTLSAEDILSLQSIVRRVPVADHVARYALRFTRLTRREKGDVPQFIQRLRQLGRRAAGQPIPGAGGQGPGRVARSLSRRVRGRSRRCRAGAAASDCHVISTPKPKASRPTISFAG